MERSPLKSVENTRREPAEKSYKKLYHELVERHSVLQSQLESYNNLFQKMEKIEQLKGQVLATLSEKQAELERQSEELGREKEDWELALSKASLNQRELEKTCADLHATCDMYHSDYTAMSGRLLAQLAIVKAQHRVQQQTVQSLKQRVTGKRVEVQKLKKTVSKYAQSLQRNRREFQESLDFSEAERATLAEENAELNGKVSTLTVQLSEANQLNQQARILLKEREAALEALSHQKDEEEQDTTIDITATAESGGCGQTCSGCGQLRSELDAALLKLNEQSCAKYGDLLRENFTLTQKLKSLEETVSRGMSEFERLTTYTQEYKTKSKYKIDVLKENLSKAEEEVSELDHIIDQVREVMHKEIGVVKHSPALLRLIRELDGVEAPNSY